MICQHLGRGKQVRSLRRVMYMLNLSSTILVFSVQQRCDCWVARGKPMRPQLLRI
jgi:hypothetical protein